MRRRCLMTSAAQMEDRIENLLEAGVLDPAKVTRSGLMNACGIAGIMLTTQARRRAARRHGGAAGLPLSSCGAPATASRRCMTRCLMLNVLHSRAARHDTN